MDLDQDLAVGSKNSFNMSENFKECTNFIQKKNYFMSTKSEDGWLVRKISIQFYDQTLLVCTMGDFLKKGPGISEKARLPLNCYEPVTYPSKNPELADKEVDNVVYDKSAENPWRTGYSQHMNFRDQEVARHFVHEMYSKCGVSEKCFSLLTKQLKNSIGGRCWNCYLIEGKVYREMSAPRKIQFWLERIQMECFQCYWAERASWNM